MFDEPTDLSPDLEWMLQSNQVDDETLTDALVRHYYDPIYRLIRSWLTYPDQAHRAAQETFILATLQSKNYRGGIQVFDWLAGIAISICQPR